MGNVANRSASLGTESVESGDDTASTGWKVHEEVPHHCVEEEWKEAVENGSHLPLPEEGTEAVSLIQEENLNASKKNEPVTTTTKSPTVQRILDLLSEMEATSQLEHCGLQKFHPCPLCSGKLITV